MLTHFLDFLYKQNSYQFIDNDWVKFEKSMHR